MSAVCRGQVTDFPTFGQTAVAAKCLKVHRRAAEFPQISRARECIVASKTSKCFQLLERSFSVHPPRFGVERGMLEASPSSPRHAPVQREVRVFWKKLTRSKLNAEVRLALKLILVTAQRPGEVALAAWNEFVFQDSAQCRVGPIALRESLAVGLA
jgi:hypothetical protein